MKLLPLKLDQFRHSALEILNVTDDAEYAHLLEVERHAHAQQLSQLKSQLAAAQAVLAVARRALPDLPGGSTALNSANRRAVMDAFRRFAEHWDDFGDESLYGREVIRHLVEACRAHADDLEATDDL